jgi:hypothetical protein
MRTRPRRRRRRTRRDVMPAYVVYGRTARGVRVPVSEHRTLTAAKRLAERIGPGASVYDVTERRTLGRVLQQGEFVRTEASGVRRQASDKRRRQASGARRQARRRR